MKAMWIVVATVVGVIGIVIAFSGSTLAGQGSSEIGRYQLAASSHTGVSSIYRIDTATGEVSLCYIEGQRADGLRVECTRSDRE